ncbi:MAG: hypothetical protein A3G18_07525 [Rhodospirillales bacterium RIFCSPLOWO2_12_FULL_58_28]|nr:MAG: hypothetical protein A3H92_09000 [Rhodospirillales bacterium RIFCSPLOWO2_02_FULL_58_16]OHC77572.1 MAG: hypothetical protein A3G18_07525 [Rhodospirillales bacterium RIFCSPLOWO2_12_FULL_58_28]
MKILRAPYDLPNNARYKIFGSGERCRLLREILEKVCPTAECLGFKTDIASTKDHDILLCEPDWPKTLEELVCAGQDETGIFVIPLPEGYVHAYWEMSRNKSGLPLNNETFFTQYIYEDGHDNDWRRHYFYYSHELIAENMARIEAVIYGLSDHRSREEYKMILSAKPPVIWDHHVKNAFKSMQYFDKCISVKPGDVIINCGVHNGFEIPFFLACLAGAGELHNIDPLGFDFLSDYVRKNILHFKEICIERRLALAGYDGTILLPILNDGQALGSAVNVEMPECKSMEFPCVTVDSYVASQRPARVDLIKMDLEGAEPHVIPGMVDTIQKFRPQLAVSIYHRKRHLWELPLFLMKQCEDYRFFIRCYSHKYHETILYAVPAEAG